MKTKNSNNREGSLLEEGLFIDHTEYQIVINNMRNLITNSRNRIRELDKYLSEKDKQDLELDMVQLERAIEVLEIGMRYLDSGISQYIKKLTACIFSCPHPIANVACEEEQSKNQNVRERLFRFLFGVFLYDK